MDAADTICWSNYNLVSIWYSLYNDVSDTNITEILGQDVSWRYSFTSEPASEL